MVPPEQQDFAVDLVIAVHNTARPVGRAVESVARSGLVLGEQGGVRVTVVCHNVSIEEIAAQIGENLRDKIRYLHLRDGIRSPAGPLNMGLDHATARYSAVMGSDDMHEPGALRDWFDLAEKYGSDAVIARQRHADGRKIRTPVLRVGRTRDLDPVKDRLSYRTAPLGLIRTATIRRLGLRFSEGLPTGEDQEFSAKLWFGADRIDYAARAGQYVVGADAADRVTYARRAVSQELEFVVRLARSDWYLSRSQRTKNAIATKLTRVHFFNLILTRHESGGWSNQDLGELRSILNELLATAETAVCPLSIADRRLIDAILEPHSTEGRLVELALARRRFGRIDTVLPQVVRFAWSPESPVRFLPASAMLR
ncbi:glycosyltransferase [Arthrobacter sp. D2-10]